MEEELASLRERIDLLERRWEEVRELADRIDSQVSSGRDLEDHFIMRALLLLGGDAYRDRMLRWLDRLVQQEKAWIEVEGKKEGDLLRLEYWRDNLRKREPWPDFPPDGWMSRKED